MIKFALTSLFVMSVFGCSTNNSVTMDNNDVEIVRNQFQRGRVEFQIINSVKTLTIVNNDTIEKLTTIENWNKVNSLISKINLNTLANLTVPENAKAHQFDGSAAVHIKITSDKKEYQTPTYDQGKSPKEIYELDKFLSSLSK